MLNLGGRAVVEELCVHASAPRSVLKSSSSVPAQSPPCSKNASPFATAAKLSLRRSIWQPVG